MSNKYVPRRVSPLPWKMRSDERVGIPESISIDLWSAGHGGFVTGIYCPPLEGGDAEGRAERVRLQANAAYIAHISGGYPEACALLAELLAVLDANERVDMHRGDGGAAGRKVDVFLSKALQFAEEPDA